MKKVLQAIVRFFDIIYKLLLTYSQVVLLVIVAIVSAQVFARNVLRASIRWSEEVALLLMVWMAFISMAIGVEKKLHIYIALFFKMFPKPVQKVVERLNYVGVTWFAINLMYYGCKLIASTSTSTLPATQWPAFTLYLMMPVSGLFILYFTILDFFGLELHKETGVKEAANKNV